MSLSRRFKIATMAETTTTALFPHIRLFRQMHAAAPPALFLRYLVLLLPLVVFYHHWRYYCELHTHFALL